MSNGLAAQPAVINVSIGGPEEWRRLELSLMEQLIMAGVGLGESEQVCDELQKIYFKWCPAPYVIDTDERVRHVLLPRVEKFAAASRIAINGMIFELLKRAIEAYQHERKPT